MEIWRFIDDGSHDAEYNMALDYAIAVYVKKKKSKPTLRLYGWNKPSVTLGIFQTTEKINLDYCYFEGIPVVRRPTGGRGILHYDELTYSFSSQYREIFGGGLFQSYYKLALVFKRAFELTGINAEISFTRRTRVFHGSPLCFKSTSYGEVSFNGEKIIGSAQRRWRDGFLQQGSIPYHVDDNVLKKIFRISEKDYPSGATGIRHLMPDFDPSLLKKNIHNSFQEEFRIVFADSQPTSEEIELTQHLISEKCRRLC